MEKPCEKCKDLRVTLGWSGRTQITKKGSGQILCSAYVDRLLNDEFYPAENRPEDNLEAWPTCPDCLRRLDPDEPERALVPDLPDTKLDPAIWLAGFLFLGLLLLLLLL